MKNTNTTVEIDRKIAMYKALRTVKDKLNKGQLLLLDENHKPMFKEQMFLVTRVLNAVIFAEGDEDLDDIKWRLDQSDSSAGVV